MSATVYWKPISSLERSFDVSAPSGFADLMSKRFGGEPWEVGPDDLDWLRGVRDGGSPRCADWDEIISTVEKHGTIRVWREW